MSIIEPCYYWAMSTCLTWLMFHRSDRLCYFMWVFIYYDIYQMKLLPSTMLGLRHWFVH